MEMSEVFVVFQVKVTVWPEPAVIVDGVATKEVIVGGGGGGGGIGPGDGGGVGGVGVGVGVGLGAGAGVGFGVGVGFGLGGELVGGKVIIGGTGGGTATGPCEIVPGGGVVPVAPPLPAPGVTGTKIGSRLPAWRLGTMLAGTLCRSKLLAGTTCAKE